MKDTLSTWQRYRPFFFLVLALVMGAMQIVDIVGDEAGVLDWLVLIGSVFVFVSSVRELLARRSLVAD